MPLVDAFLIPPQDRKIRTGLLHPATAPGNDRGTGMRYDSQAFPVRTFSSDHDFCLFVFSSIASSYLGEGEGGRERERGDGRV